MTKEEEITILKKLKQDGYLVDAVGINGINQMIENIKNDFPINNNVWIPIAIHDSKILSKDQEMEELINFKKELLNTSINMIEEYNPLIIEDFINDNYMIEDIILKKLEFEIDLEENEIEFIKHIFKENK